ncbi:MAG: putative heme-dependent peroxidase [Verrucomicrobia subdivision 3 bacterium]|nr:putative heme-dependent peroxidase [Limisphaerales bacterium]MCS1415338.1 putative heme-dependent peroxidase [Limisphaerales bacterium]
MAVPVVRLDQGIHVMHLFYRMDRTVWADQMEGVSANVREKLEALVAANANPCQPRIVSFVNVGGKADLVFMIYAEELAKLSELHRELEGCFPPDAIDLVYSYLSVTELPEYVTTEDDLKRMIIGEENLEEGTDEFAARFDGYKKKQKEYQHYRLYPELPDWEVMGFYPMSKRRSGVDNWYALDFDTRKKLMTGHAKVGRQYAGRISQLITGSTGLDDWEWGVTLMAHQVDALKEIVYEMRFDEVSARYGEFGPFYVNLRMDLGGAWEHLKL